MKRENENTDDGAVLKKSCLEFPALSIVRCKKKSNNEFLLTGEHKKHFSSKFISCMYRLHVSILCLLRKLRHEQVFPSLSISFDDSEIDRFRDIVIRYKKRSIHVQIVDDHFIDYGIGYSRLFSKNQLFSLNTYFNSFVKYQICRSFNFLKHVRYLVIYTNLDLDLTESQDLNDGKNGNKWKSYPIKLEKVDVTTLEIYKELLFIEKTSKNTTCFQFSQDAKTRGEVFEKLELSPTMQKLVNTRKLTKTFINKIKEKFLKKLVFAVNQPHREELRMLIKSELNQTHYTFTELQKKVLNSISPRPLFLYELNFLTSLLNDLIIHDAFYLNYENIDATSLISVYFKGKITLIRVVQQNKKIDYHQLFPMDSEKEKSKLSLIWYFLDFVEHLQKKECIKFLIIYTNAQLDLMDNNTLRRMNSKSSLQFMRVNTNNRRFKLLHHVSGIDKYNLYQLNPENIMTLTNLLEYPSRYQGKYKAIPDKELMHLKETFFHKLILATNQFVEKDIECIIKSRVQCLASYDYEELQETVMRWTESCKLGFISSSIARQLLDDVKNNRSIYQRLQRKDIAKEIQFARSIVGTEESLFFRHFLQYIVFGEGKKYLRNFQNSGLKLSNISGILSLVRSKAIMLLKRLHDLWYDYQDRESFYLYTLRQNGLKITTVCTLLNSARHFAIDAFLNLFSLWFDHDGNKTRYLSVLENNGLSLIHLSSILIGAGPNIPIAFKDLIDLLFDKESCKTKYLRMPEELGIVLRNFSSILRTTGKNSAEAFKDLYDVWFDEDGNRTFYLKILEKNNFNLSVFRPLLKGSRFQAARMFKEVFYLFFNKDGSKTYHLKAFEKQGVSLLNLTSILGGASFHISKALKDLYNLWFDDQGNKTLYLKGLSDNGIDLQVMSSILHDSGIHAAQAYKNLYHLWIDKEGKKSVYLQTLERNKIGIDTMASMLNGSRKFAPDAYKAMHQVFFDEQGNKSERLKHLEKEGVSLTNMSTLLSTSGSQIKTAFDDLYNLWFDELGNKTDYLNNIEKNGLRISQMSSVLYCSGCHSARAYKSLYDCWFDEHGNKTRYLEVFEENGLNLLKIVGILQKGGRYSDQIFVDLYNSWFDDKGRKSSCILALEREGIDLLALSIAIRRSGRSAPKCFKNFYGFWFDEDGNRTNFFNVLSKNGITLQNVLNIFIRLRVNSVKVIHDVYYLWFTAEGNRTQYSLILEMNEIELNQVIRVLYKTDTKFVTTFTDLFNLWFDSSGNKTQYLLDIEKRGMSAADMVTVLSGSGKRSIQKFMKLANH